MIEPWVTSWARFVYTRFHSEPFRPDARTWSFPATGPLSGANGAVPWMVFVRDRVRFDREFSALEVKRIVPMMPFRYLVSGGVSLRSLSPAWSYPLWCAVERLLEPFDDRLAMFALIVVERRP